MQYHRHGHNRRSIRLRTWEYRERGAYFVTICTFARALLFEDAELRAVAEEAWRTVVWGIEKPDRFVVMPNHVHGIIWIPGATAVGAQQPTHLESCGPPMCDLSSSTDDSVAASLRGLDLVRRVEPGALRAIVRTFKSSSAKRINRLRGTPGAAVWQRNYYGRVIRDERELERAREYIADNPRKWAQDKYNPLRNFAGG